MSGAAKGQPRKSRKLGPDAILKNIARIEPIRLLERALAYTPNIWKDAPERVTQEAPAGNVPPGTSERDNDNNSWHSEINLAEALPGFRGMKRPRYALRSPRPSRTARGRAKSGRTLA